VRETAERWGCSPGTAGRAYAQLAREGLVEGYAGGGTRVRPGPLPPRDPGLGWAALVNRAEGFLLEALGEGHPPTRVEAALALAVARWSDLQREGAPAAPPAPPAAGLRFAGSHDLAFDLLGERLAAGVLASIEHLGSLGGLIALARGEADLAGSHLWDSATDSYNRPFVSRLLPGRRVALLTLAHRALGLITGPGNPRRLDGLADLARPGLRFVNRQPGSGTRVWLDAHLPAAGVDPAAVAGYEQEAPTHLAVARAVGEGRADAGLGIAAAANAYGLGFAPLVTERYDLVFPEEAWGTPAALAIREAVRSAAFAAAVAGLGGYDTSGTGREEWVEG
jgi:molybdate-binding protein